MNEKEFNEFKKEIIKLTEETIKLHPYLRKGQTLFNIIYERCPEIANQIRSTENDPFYLDSRIDNFFNELKKHLIKK
jgi:hypothetical protein